MGRVLRHKGWLTHTEISVDDVWVKVERKTPLLDWTRRIAIQAIDSVDETVRLNPLLLAIGVLAILGGLSIATSAAEGRFAEEDRLAAILLGAAVAMLGLLIILMAREHSLLIRSVSGKRVWAPFPQGEDGTDVLLELEAALRRLREVRSLTGQMEK